MSLQVYYPQDIQRALVMLASAGRDRGDEYRLALIDVGVTLGLIPPGAGNIHVNDEVREIKEQARKVEAEAELALASEQLYLVRQRAWMRQALCIGHPPEGFMNT